MLSTKFGRSPERLRLNKATTKPNQTSTRQTRKLSRPPKKNPAKAITPWVCYRFQSQQGTCDLPYQLAAKPFIIPRSNEIGKLRNLQRTDQIEDYSKLFICAISENIDRVAKRSRSTEKMLSKLSYFLPPCLRQEEDYALDNGSILLEDLIASCDGNSNPIRHYSAQELIRATNNFDPINLIHAVYLYNSDYEAFRGFLENRYVIIKKMENRDAAIRDIIISMQMSSHKNVLKLLGCCLEFRVPVLVYEYAAKGVLNDRGGYGDNESLPWRTRLCIAKQVANAVTYLHTAFPRPIIHRRLEPSSIFLDNDFTPKLCHFSHSVTIPPDQSHVEGVTFWTTYAYFDPEYLASSFITEKTDVYSFGVILLVFMTGLDASMQAGMETIESYVELHASDGQFQTIVDPKILGELRGGEDEQAQQQQLQDFLALALLCTQVESEARPDMIDVAKELVRIEKSIIPC